MKHILGCDDDLPKIYARKCIVKEITYKDAKLFFEKNTIQNHYMGTLYFGCFYEDGIIGAMSFKRERELPNRWKLLCFARDISKHCIGIGGKLFKYFLKKNKTVEINCFADRRWVFDKNNNLYTRIGFKLVKTIKPDYKYVIRNKRIDKSIFNKEILLKKYPNSSLTKEMTLQQMCEKLGFYRIWDCGLYKYVWENYKYEIN